MEFITMWLKIFVSSNLDSIWNSSQRGEFYSYTQKSDMNKHIAVVHEGRKPFKCDICDYSCSQKCDTHKHIEAVHEGRKPFVIFVTIATLKRVT